MKTVILLLSGVLVALLSQGEAVKFGQLCSENPSNRRRTSDSWGQGHYGAGRGTRKHLGLDIVCGDGATVYVPFDVELKGKVVVYNDPKKAAINNGINLSGEGLCFKLFYVKPVKYNGKLKKGSVLGTLLPMQTVYPGITSHVHVQMCDKSDPTKYF